MFEKFDVPLGKSVASIRNDRFTLSNLHECDCIDIKHTKKKYSIPITKTLMDFELTQKGIAPLKEENI